MTPEAFQIPFESAAVTAITYPATDTAPAVETRTRACFILSHGAGAGQKSPFITSFAAALARFGVDAVTFDFPYMERRRRIPDRRPVLEACYGSVIAAVRARVDSAAHALFIGGKSMGGRIASHVATDPALGLAGLILLGYPLHPPGRPSERRDGHLPSISCPVFVAQGTRDAFGTPDEIAPAFAQTPHTTLHVISGGDHSFKVGRSGPTAQAAVLDDVQRTIVEWMAATTVRASGSEQRRR